MRANVKHIFLLAALAALLRNDSLSDVQSYHHIDLNISATTGWIAI